MKKLVIFALVAMFVLGVTLSISAKPVELIWYMPGGGNFPYADIEEVHEKFNAMVENDLGIRVKIIIPGTFAEYKTKMPAMMAAGEKFDLVFTASWSNDYIKAATDELYAPLDELLPKYAPTIWADIGEVLEASRVNGTLYGVWGQQIAATTSNVQIIDELVEKYGWDMSAIEKIQDVTPILADIKANEPDLIPMNGRKPPTGWAMPSLGYVGIAGDLLAVRADDPAGKVFSLLEDPAFVDVIKMAHEWYVKGYLPKDGLTYQQDQWAKLKNTGKTAVDLHNTWHPKGAPHILQTGQQVSVYPYGPSTITGHVVISNMQAISAASKHKEEAMKFLEYLWTNKEAFELLVYGIEGKHYTRLENGTVERDPNSGYYPNCTWAYGNTFLPSVTAPAPPDHYAAVKELNATAKKWVLLGFMPDISKVKTLMASVRAVQDQYRTAVETGYVDPEVELPKYIKALKQAGLDDLQTELQKQIDEFIASR